jgi:predicted aldo/keto reductase-like oxidoreductase
MVDNHLDITVDVHTTEDFEDFLDDIEDASNSLDRISDGVDEKVGTPCPRCGYCPHCGRRRRPLSPYDKHYY